MFGKDMDRPLGDEFDEDASLRVNTSNSLQSSKYLKKKISYFRKKNYAKGMSYLRKFQEYFNYFLKTKKVLFLKTTFF